MISLVNDGHFEDCKFYSIWCHMILFINAHPFSDEWVIDFNSGKKSSRILWVKYI